MPKLTRRRAAGTLRWVLTVGGLALLVAGRAPVAAAAGPFLTPTPAVAGAAPSQTPAPTALPDSSGGNQASVTPTPASVPQPTATPSANRPSPTAGPSREREDRLALLLDRARVVAGLLPLARSPELDRAAASHAQDMVALGYLDHYAPDGSSPGSRAQREGYNFPTGSGWMAIEAITASSDAPEGALSWLLGDGLHSHVVLHPSWRELGIAYAAGGLYGRFWVLEFGCRPNVLPPVLLDGTLSIPDETCYHGYGAFDSVQSVRIGDRSDAARNQAWASYGAQMPWPRGKTAVVDFKDMTGREMEASAADPTGAPLEPLAASP
jgi:uncharacterized protein YkwD